MLFQVYGDTAIYQWIGWILVFCCLIGANELARRTKTGGVIAFLIVPAILTIYFITIYVAAAMGVAQMELLPGFIKRKHEVMDFYKKELSGVGDIRFQEVGSDVDPNCWLPTIMNEKQKDVLKILNDNKMQSRPFWVPMNQLRMFKENIFYNKDNRSDYVYQRCLSIPCSTNITDEQMKAVCEKIKEVY